MPKVVDRLVCGRCGSEKFRIGPRGGAAINVFCMECGKYYNITPLPDGKIWIVNE